MGQIVPPGQFNSAALAADDLYIQLVNPPSFARGVATDVIALVGTASWGPIDTPVHLGSPSDGGQAFGTISAASLTDSHDLATDIAIAFGQASSEASMEAWCVRVSDGTDVAASGTLAGAASSASQTATITGTITNGDVERLTFTSSALAGSPINIDVTAATGDTLTTLAAKFVAAINANAVLAAAGIYATNLAAVISVYQPTTLSPAMVLARTNAGTEIITIGAGAAVTAGITIQGVCTGTLGNQISVIVQAGAATNTFTASVVPPQGISEVYPNLPAAGFWGALQTAINNGMSGVRGPSSFVKALNANNSVGAPTVASITLAGGTDGRALVTTARILGNDAVYPKTGMYALRGLNPGVGITWLVGVTDSTAISPLKAFGLSEGSAVLHPFAPGTSTTVGVGLAASNGVHDPALTYVKDWIYFFDTINNQVRLVPPTAFIGGTWATYSPEQSPSNKSVNLVVGTERLPPSTPGQPYSSSEIAQLANAGITLVTNPIPAGSTWGIREGQSTSLDPATAPMEWWRMTAFLARSLNVNFGGFVGQLQSQQPNDPLRAAVSTKLNDFMNRLGDMIDSYQVICAFSASANAKPGMGINTPGSVAAHYMYALVKVRYLSSVRFFILSLQGGTTVVTVSSQQQAA